MPKFSKVPDAGNPPSYTPTLLLQDFAYSYRVWITMNKLLYAPLRYLKNNPTIFTYLSKYALGCYLRYRWFPRRTLLGSLLIKPLTYAPVR